MNDLQNNRFPWKVFSRLVMVQSALILAALIVSGFSARYFFKSSYTSQIENQLLNSLTTLSHNMPPSLIPHWCALSAQGTDMRLTVVSETGIVVCDSHHDFSKMDNHLLRPEIQSALKFHLGTSIRKSSTLNEEMIYSAIFIPDKKIFLRAAAPLQHLKNALASFDAVFCTLFAIVLAALMFFSIWSGKNFIEPLKRMLVKTENMLANQALPVRNSAAEPETFGEWAELEKSIDQISLENMKRAEQMRIDFVANVSHELKTPLTAIKGYIDTIKFDIATGKPVEKHYLEIIERNTERLISLIQDLLELSSLDRGIAFNKSRVDLKEITAKAVQQLKAPIQSKHQILTAHYGVQSLIADPDRLEQVLINLLDNAHKYTQPSGKIEIIWEAGAENETILKVRDSGPGISKEHHPRLFERFYRLDKARSRDVGGTGLGLSIVKHIMQGHDGEVWVESQIGEGSTFICRFPDSISPSI